MTKDEMLEQFTVLGFYYDLCVVERKADGVRGTLGFYNDNGVRKYYNWQES
jgi:hypothetical protein